ncbi:hypothetical protein H1_114 [Efunavirus H1]|uniref:Uncharacterized protein n=1 Tax=Enterococcus phage H1 TaxID=2982918 RepID=A0AAE9P5A6_9CAUD|nr:hypothetical protein H1_114 [Enterococcus phage H1]
MTIEQIIKQLESLPEDEKKLKLYVCDINGDNYEIDSISLYDEETSHSPTNPLGLNYSIKRGNEK